MVRSDAAILQEKARELDAADPLSGFRSRFKIPDGLVYLDGNSLGALQHSVIAKVKKTIETDWGTGLISSWNDAGWIELPRRAAGKIAKLIGTQTDCVAVTDSTSVNLFKVLSAALALRPERLKIVTESDNFPTDLYIADGLKKLLGDRHKIVQANVPAELPGLIDGDTAVLMLTHVNYRTGRMHNMEQLSRIAHAQGALVIWDLAHSAGAVEVKLDESGSDFAVGCGYKFLNGGPGAPAFVQVARKHHQRANQPLTGWFSHASPFEFGADYHPAAGVTRFYAGTPAILSLCALDAALEIWTEISLAEIRKKSVLLTEFFIELVELLCTGTELELVSPREASERGSQVSFACHEDGYAIMQALINEKIIGDFRGPDIIRFGFAPLYTSFSDVFTAAETLSRIVEGRLWDRPEFKNRRAVT